MRKNTITKRLQIGYNLVTKQKRQMFHKIKRLPYSESPKIRSKAAVSIIKRIQLDQPSYSLNLGALAITSASKLEGSCSYLANSIVKPPMPLVI